MLGNSQELPSVDELRFIVAVSRQCMVGSSLKSRCFRCWLVASKHRDFSSKNWEFKATKMGIELLSSDQPQMDSLFKVI